MVRQAGYHSNQGVMVRQAGYRSNQGAMVPFLLQFLNFLLVPLHLRTVFMGGCAFLWACFLCFSRQDGDGTAGLALAFLLHPRLTTATPPPTPETPATTPPAIQPHQPTTPPADTQHTDREEE